MYDKFTLALIDLYSAQKNNAIKDISDKGLSEAQPKILYILSRNDGIIQKNLAELAMVSTATLSVILDKMIRDGLVKKESFVTSGGKKSMKVYLTTLGKLKSMEVDTYLETLEERSMRDFTAEEKSILLFLLQRVKSNLS